MDDLVTYDLAVKLKEKGFREECFARYYCSDKAYLEGNSYNPDTESVFYCYNNDEDLGRFYIDAPTIPQVLKWLRDTHKLFISPCVIADYQDDFHRDTTYWSFIIVNIESCDSIYREYERVTEKRFNSYEQATVAGISYVLEILI